MSALADITPRDLHNSSYDTKPNSIIVLLFIQNNSSFKNKLKHTNLHRCYVHLDSACLSGSLGDKGLFRFFDSILWHERIRNFECNFCQGFISLRKLLHYNASQWHSQISFRYYKDDKAVQEDKELEAFLNELSLNGTGENGGIGRVSIGILMIFVPPV